MRILIAHNRYQQEGGEDGVVDNEARMLAAQGMDVALHVTSNHAISGWRSKLNTLAHVAYSWPARKAFAASIAAERPDIVHVHNFFPLLTPSIYDACAEAGVPVVQTLHNYRTICAGALLLRDGRPCQTCIGHSPYWGAWHGCYRDSHLASAGAAHMIAAHNRSGTWKTKVGRFIALSEFARQRFIAGGLPANRIAVKPNVVFPPPDRAPVARHGGLFVGRLSPEKGIETLVRAWENIGYPLTVAGDGPLRQKMQTLAGPDVHFTGKLSRDQVTNAMSGAAFIVVPSVCYENFPLAIAEGFSCALPAIVSRLGAMAEIVEDGRTGLHFDPDDSADLAAKVRWAVAHPKAMVQMGRNALAYYHRHLAPEANAKALMDVYTAARSRHVIPEPAEAAGAQYSETYA